MKYYEQEQKYCDTRIQSCLMCVQNHSVWSLGSLRARKQIGGEIDTNLFQRWLHIETGSWIKYFFFSLHKALSILVLWTYRAG